MIGINADCQKELIALNGILNKQTLLIILKAEDCLRHVLLLRMTKGFKEAIENVYPKAMHITCTVHMIRDAAKYVLHSMKPDFLRDLKKYIWCKQLKRRKTQSFEYLKNK